MAAVLLSVHVIAAIVFVGGSSVATSLFPRYVPVAPEGVQEGADDGRSRTVAAAMHRITRGYSIAAIIVPAAGIVLALLQGRMGELWIILSLVLTAAAGVLLAWQINPASAPPWPCRARANGCAPDHAGRGLQPDLGGGRGVDDHPAGRVSVRGRAATPVGDRGPRCPGSAPRGDGPPFSPRRAGRA
ncbi:hypothetical protein ACFQYP_35220 [Nonomuraea antimicrobica]